MAAPGVVQARPLEWMRVVGSIKFSGLPEIEDLARRHRAVSAAVIKLVAFRAALYADVGTGANIRPGVALLAAECEVGVRAVETVLRLLVDIGLLEVTRRGGGRGRGGTATTYRLIFADGLSDRVTCRSPTDVDVDADRRSTRR
jgi:hypothetical protein